MVVPELKLPSSSSSEEGTKVVPLPPLRFVLVHGLGSGAWCWYKVRSLLEKAGYKVSCPDLKSGGIDQTDPSFIRSFDEYNQPLIDLLSSLLEASSEKVILVGHSAGGLSVTNALHKFGKKISLAIYVGATMLRRGFLTDDDKKDGIPDLSDYGDIYEPPNNTIMKREFMRKIIFNMSPDEDATLGWMLEKTGPFEVIASARFVESVLVDEVKRLYVKTQHDHVLKLEQQEAMVRKWPPVDVFSIESDHCPNVSAPGELFQILVKTVGQC